MFLALSDITEKKMTQRALSAGLRMDGLGTVIGGVFNTFPYTSFSQNVGLVGVTGIRSRYVCVAGGAIMIVLGLIPKMGALVEALPTVVLGGAGLVMFGMVAATGIRILSRVDFASNRNNLFVVAISIGLGMIPLVAPDFKMWLPHAIHPLIDSGHHPDGDRLGAAQHLLQRRQGQRRGPAGSGDGGQRPLTPPEGRTRSRSRPAAGFSHAACQTGGACR